MKQTNRCMLRPLRPLGPLGPLALVLVAVLGFGLAGCTNDSMADDEKTEDGEEVEDKTVPVEVVALARGPIEEVLRFSTNIEAEKSVGVYSQAARQVVELRVEEGDRVQKGAVLLRLQDDEQRTRIAKVQGQLGKVRREHDRQERLFNEGLIPEQDFNDVTYELAQLQLELETAQRELSYTVVRAPISGTVSRRLVNRGDNVTVNQQLFDLVDFSSLVARVYVPEKELAKLRAGVVARVTAPALGGAEYAGRIERLSPIVDPHSGTIKVTVAIPEWQGLRPGLYVDVELVTAVRDDALLVPKRALVYDRDEVFVYRLAAGGGTVERVAVVPVLEDKNYVEPGDSLAVGDRIVVAGQAGLKTGAEVRVLAASGAAAGAVGALGAGELAAQTPAPAAAETATDRGEDR